MDVVLRLVLLIGIVLVVTCICWRYAIRRFSLPCPSWLSVILEIRLMERRVGSAMLLDRAHVAPGMRVLDVGCGPGRLAIPAAEHVGPEGKVVAVDIQESMLRKLKKRIEKKSLTIIKMVHAGAGEGKINQNAFDRAFLVTVLGEIPDKRRALVEIYNALRPDGLLSITEMLPDPHYQSRRTVRRVAEGAGFRFEESYGNVLGFTLNFSKSSE